MVYVFLGFQGFSVLGSRALSFEASCEPTHLETQYICLGFVGPGLGFTGFFYLII